MLTQEELKKRFHYNKDAGVFTYIISCGSVKKGRIAGVKCKNGYLRVRVNKSDYLLHRLAWLYVYGVWPKNQIDHKNHMRDDNRINNLREATNQENAKNQSLLRTSASGVIGVCWKKSLKKWHSRIGIDRKEEHLGYFSDKFEAICCRKSAENKHGFHENHGMPRL